MTEAMMRGDHVWSGMLVGTIATAMAFTVDGASPGPSGIYPAPGEPWIVYQGGETIEGAWPIRLVRLDGSGDHVLQLGDLPGYDQGHPAWSPNGERIAFDLFTHLEGSPDRVSIWSVDPDGGHPMQLATCASPCLELAYPAWSPDGREIALSRYDFEADGTWGPSAIEVLDLASGDRRVMTVTANGTSAVYTPRWSPDGSAIVFVIETYTDATEETVTSSVIASIPTDGSTSTPTVLTSIDSVADAPDWGPDGHIALARFDSIKGRPESGTIATIASDGSDVRVFGRADSGLVVATEPTWTSDGRLLVGTGDPATGTQWLAWMHPETGQAERLPWDLVTATPGNQRTHHHLRPEG
jgi:Tol biopolymer transport system component